MRAILFGLTLFGATLTAAHAALPPAETPLPRGTGFQGAACYRPERAAAVAFRLPVADPQKPHYLFVRYSGEQRPAKGEELLFTVAVDGEKLVTHEVNNSLPQHFFDLRYAVPARLTQGKSSVRVTFTPLQPGRGRVAELYHVELAAQKTTDGDFDNPTNFNTRTATPDQPLIYTEPVGWTVAGFHSANERGLDATRHYGLEVDAEPAGDAVLTWELLGKGDTTLARFPMALTGRGGRRFHVPFERFDVPRADASRIADVRRIRLSVQGSPVTVRSMRLLDGLSFAAETPRKGLAADREAVYPVTLTNTERESQVLTVTPLRHGWEAMACRVEPALLPLAPGESKVVRVIVTIPESIPAAGREKQLISIVPSANPAAARTLELHTAKRLPHPYLVHTRERWEEIRHDSLTIPWMKKSRKNYIDKARAWRIPAVPPQRGGFSLFRTAEEWNAFSTAVAYRLTGQELFARKVREFLLIHADPASGWPMTRKGSDQASVQEGHYFQHLAQAYDMTADSTVYSAADRQAIEAMFHEFATDTARWVGPGGANWAVSSLTGAFFAALATQDLALTEHLLEGPSMLLDKLRAYTMSDGWWYECTVSYNVWCTEEYIQIALASETFGFEVLNRKFPVNYLMVPDFATAGTPEQEKTASRTIHHGHSFRIRGGIQKPYFSIRDMAEGLLKCLDYRGWVFGINDSTERFAAGQIMELFYYAFRDPRAAEFIRLQPERSDLIYGVPELPKERFTVGADSYASDNFGTLVLRSRNAAEPRERIQAVLKYGTHGGYHGHFDRTALLSLQRYGRSFYNPEMIWFGYASIFYNFYVQSSISKNMVVVDGKQQSAEDSRRLLFAAGPHLQAGCVESIAEWSYPAWGGLRHSMAGFNKSVRAKSERENRHLAIPSANEPEFGHLTGFTEPILQRRLLGVTDDFIVIADYAKSPKPHQFDLLFQIKGLKRTSAAPSGQLPQLDDDPLKAAQLVTNLDLYQPEGTFEAEFQTGFGPGADNRGSRIYGEPGLLKLRTFFAWPRARRTAFIGFAPETLGTERTFRWSVAGDGKILAEGKVPTWVIGAGTFRTDLKGVRTLTLATTLPALGRNAPRTLFWGDATLRTAAGKTIPLSALKPVTTANVLAPAHGAGRDFEGGAIAIAGHRIADALSAEPAKPGEDPAQYTFDLTGLDAVELTGRVGGDFPVGDESQRRRVLGMRQQGDEARFLTVVEPFEGESVIASVAADGPDSLTVRLKDGRVRHFKVANLDTGRDVAITMTEERDGKTTITEQLKQEPAQ